MDDVVLQEAARELLTALRGEGGLSPETQRAMQRLEVVLSSEDAFFVADEDEKDEPAH